MKRILSKISTLALGLFMTAALFAQTEEGTLIMEITDVSSDNPQVAAMADMMKGNETMVYFKDGESLTKINMMGGMIKIDLKQDQEQNMDMLMDAMGQKIWVAATKLEQDKMKAGADDPMEYMEITYDEEDTKTIAGFDCYKMSVVFPDAEGVELQAYISEDIGVRPSIIQGVNMKEFKGLPLEYSFINPQMTMQITAKSFEPTADASVFELNTAGFQKMTMEEFIEMTQQFGGGGFGF